MNGYLSLVMLAGYAVILFVGGLVWKRMHNRKEHRRQPRLPLARAERNEGYAAMVGRH
jgi:hypothetical protein